MNEAIKQPQNAVCYLCGKHVYIQAMGNHLDSCKRNWEYEHASKKQSMRSPMASKKVTQGIEVTLENSITNLFR